MMPTISFSLFLKAWIIKHWYVVNKDHIIDALLAIALLLLPIPMVVNGSRNGGRGPGSGGRNGVGTVVVLALSSNGSLGLV